MKLLYYYTILLYKITKKNQINHGFVDHNKTEQPWMYMIIMLLNINIYINVYYKFYIGLYTNDNLFQFLYISSTFIFSKYFYKCIKTTKETSINIGKMRF